MNLLNKVIRVSVGLLTLAHNGGNKARLAYTELSNYHRTLQPNGLYCVLSAAFLIEF